MNVETTNLNIATRRKVLRQIARHSGLVLLGAVSSGNPVAAGPSADCKFHCKKKARRKARRRCYDRCNHVSERCQGNPDCVAEQMCGDARCMTLCSSDTECFPGGNCQDGACVGI